MSTPFRLRREGEERQETGDRRKETKRFSPLPSLLSCLPLLLLLSLQPAGAQLRAGVAKIDITPDVKAASIPLGGYAARLGRPATGVHDLVYSRALVLEEGGKRVGIVSIDLCFLPANIKSEVLEKLKSGGVEGWSSENLMLVATHSHTSPDPLAMHSGNNFALKGWSPFDAALLHFTTDRIASSIKEAQLALVEAKAGIGIVDASGLNRNRRGEKTTDPAMSILKITDLKGRNLSCLVNFAAHPTLYDDKMMDVSADWPGAMESNLDKALGENGVSLFLNGAEGDASPNGVDAFKGEEKVVAFGKLMSDLVLKNLPGIPTSSAPKLTSTLLKINLPPRKASGAFLLATGNLGASIPQAKALVNGIMPEKTTVQLVTLGDFIFVGMPCEPTAEVGLRIREIVKKAGKKRVGVVALANDWLAYCLTPEQYKRGNYEAMMSFYGDQFAPSLLSGLESALLPKKPLKKTVKKHF